MQVLGEWDWHAVLGVGAAGWVGVCCSLFKRCFYRPQTGIANYVFYILIKHARRHIHLTRKIGFLSIYGGH